MLNPSKLTLARKRLFWIFVVFTLAAPSFPMRLFAQDLAMKDRIYVVTHIDVLPNTPGGAKLLQHYAEETRKEKGAERIELYVQISRTNHFTLVEVWDNQADFDAHEADPHSKQFRDQLAPMLAGPFDERLHKIFEAIPPGGFR
jgi:quinol monooxygenase YgiN